MQLVIHHELVCSRNTEEEQSYTQAQTTHEEDIAFALRAHVSYHLFFLSMESTRRRSSSNAVKQNCSIPDHWG